MRCSSNGKSRSVPHIFIYLVRFVISISNGQHFTSFSHSKLYATFTGTFHLLSCFRGYRISHKPRSFVVRTAVLSLVAKGFVNVEELCRGFYRGNLPQVFVKRRSSNASWKCFVRVESSIFVVLLGKISFLHDNVGFRSQNTALQNTASYKFLSFSLISRQLKIVATK